MESVNQNQYNEVIQDNDKVIVDYFASWCGPCKKQEPILEEISSDYKVVTVDIEEEVELAKQQKIRSLPTIEFYNDGELAETSTGFSSKKDILNKIKSL